MRLLLTVVLLLGLAAAPAAAETGPPTLFAYGTFATATDPLLQLSGKATLAPPVLRLIARSDELFASSAWYARKVDVTAGWETRFEFQLTHGAGESPEGLAFVIQNDSATARGTAGAGLGFAGIANSLAIAVKTTSRANEPASPFITIQSRGQMPNDALPAYSYGSVIAPGLGDGQRHTLTVRYTPPAGAAAGDLAIYVGDADEPVLRKSLDLAELLALGHAPAWIGFTTASGLTPNVGTAEISSWSFGPASAPARIGITSAALSGTASAQATLGPLALALQDADGKPVVAPAAVDVTLRSDSSRGVFSAGPGTPSLGTWVVTIPAGQSSAEVFYGDANAGLPTLTATADGLAAATQQATINPGARAAIVLDGAASTPLDAGQLRTYAIKIVDAYGNDLGPDPSVQLSIAPDGTCVVNACSATVAGHHIVRATTSTLFAQTDLIVRPGPPATVEVSPASAAIAAGTKQTFEAHVRDTYGNLRPDPPTVTIAPDGTCSGGVCTATVAGPHTVTAASGALKDTAQLTVRPGPAATVRLSPAETSVTAGEAQAFTVAAADAFGNPLEATLDIAPDGDCDGLTCTAALPGEHTVTATAGTFTASAKLTVRPRPATALDTSAPAAPAAPPADDGEPAPVAAVAPAPAPAAPRVGLRFSGFGAPLRNGKLNRVRAGRAVTLKWRLTDLAGLPVTTQRTARLTVSPIACGRRRVAKGGRTRLYALQHRGNGNYRLKWKSRARDARTCKRLRLDVGDGVGHTVDLRLMPSTTSR